MEIMKNLKI